MEKNKFEEREKQEVGRLKYIVAFIAVLAIIIVSFLLSHIRNVPFE